MILPHTAGAPLAANPTDGSFEAHTLAGPSWDLASEYRGPESAELTADLRELSGLLDQIEALNPTLIDALPGAAGLSLAASGASLAVAQQVARLAERAGPLLSNPLTYANCLLSVDAHDDAAQALQGRLQKYQKRYDELLEPWSEYLDLVTNEIVDAYLSDPTVAHSAFKVRHGRQRRHERLGLAEENLVGGLAQDGIHAWGRMYSQLSSTMTCQVQVGNELRSMGVAEASGLLQKPDERTRKQAWLGINDAWRTHQEACAAAINAIAGWRLEMNRKRSKTRPVHFLDAPVHMNHLERRTLDALLDATVAARPLARRAAKAMARATGREQIGPWDMRAPAPQLPGDEHPIPFDAAIGLIADAYSEVDGAMGDFVRMMRDMSWIEGTVSSRKRPGRVLHRVREVAYTARLHDLSGIAIGRHYAGARVGSRIPLVGDARPARESAQLRHVARGDREHVRRNRGARCAAGAYRHAARKIRNHVGRNRGDPCVHAEHSRAFQFREVVLRKARRTPAAACRTGGVDVAGMAGMVW